MIDERAKWIWPTQKAEGANEYAFFEAEFDYRGGEALLSIAAESDYFLTVNGVMAGFGQFAGYPFEKYCDELDITSLCREGENKLGLTVRYEGLNSATHIDDGAGVIFSLEIGGACVLYSSRETLCGYDGRFEQHQTRRISNQLGYTSSMRCGTPVIKGKAVESEKTKNIKKRPVTKTVAGDFVKGAAISVSGRRIFDLGREEAGYLRLTVRAAQRCAVKVAWGEHLADGCVRYLIGTRDFSMDFALERGEHSFFQPFVRVAARYLEVFAPEGVEVLEVGLVPYLYPLQEHAPALKGLDRQIYDTAVRTLRLCMNAHYEDCPWREQALYVLDSRNQMLCGYYAFEGAEFQRANLAFIAKGVREDGMLELTYPAINTPAIPFFSLMYPVAVFEYIEHTGDRSILRETMPTMLGIMRGMAARVEEGGLIAELPRPYWNFYEWSRGSEGELERTEDGPREYSLLLNCAFVFAASRFLKLCAWAGERFEVELDVTKRAIEGRFFDPVSGLFCQSTLRPSLFSQLGQAFAVLIGLGDRRTHAALRGDGRLIPATLSMLGFVWDAVLTGGRGRRRGVRA